MITQLEYNKILTPIEAAHAASTTSDKYGFVSTKNLLDQLGTLGFTPRKIDVARVNKEERKGFQKHIVRLQHRDLLPEINRELPEIIIGNSHDGLSSTWLALGLFRCVCTNGLVVGTSFEEYRFTHRKNNVDAITGAALQLAGQAPRLLDTIERFRSRQLTLPETASFVEEAAKLRYDKPTDESTYNDQWDWNKKTSYLNRPRRWDDKGQDLWLTFNRVQENLTQGRAHSGIRRITSATKDVDINRNLWNLAESFLN